MKPYADGRGWVLYHGDCREVLPHVGKVDAVVTDPPYGISYDGSHGKYLNGVDRGPCEWDSEPYDPSPIIELGLPSIVWGGNCFSSRLPDSTTWLVWVKISRQDADIRQSDCEMAWTNCFGRSRVFFHLWIGAYRDSESGVRNVHPTQKPVAVMEWCIRESKIRDDAVIVDPYTGSGTTGIACIRLARSFVGIERDERYCEVAARRLQRAEEDTALFANVEPKTATPEPELFTEER